MQSGRDGKTFMGESDSDQDPYAPPEAGLEGEGSELGRVDLYRAFITGSKDLEQRYVAVERYIERFRRRDKVGGIRPGWHWPVFFFAIPWLVHRSMYLVLVLYFVLPPIVLGVSGGILFADLTETELSQDPPLGILILLLSFGIYYTFFLPMYADTLYWWHTNRTIRRAERTFADPHEQIGGLRKKGGTASVWLVVLVLVIQGLIYSIS